MEISPEDFAAANRRAQETASAFPVAVWTFAMTEGLHG